MRVGRYELRNIAYSGIWEAITHTTEKTAIDTVKTYVFSDRSEMVVWRDKDTNEVNQVSIFDRHGHNIAVFYCDTLSSF